MFEKDLDFNISFSVFTPSFVSLLSLKCCPQQGGKAASFDLTTLLQDLNMVSSATSSP